LSWPLSQTDTSPLSITDTIPQKSYSHIIGGKDSMKAIDDLLDLGNRYAEQSTWKDFALTKFCLCSMGIAIGMTVPEKYRRPVLAGCTAVFAATYIPLMTKVFRTALEKTDSTE